LFATTSMRVESARRPVAAEWRAAIAMLSTYRTCRPDGLSGTVC
jgi:hypothetical protein